MIHSSVSGLHWHCWCGVSAEGVRPYSVCVAGGGGHAVSAQQLLNGTPGLVFAARVCRVIRGCGMGGEDYAMLEGLGWSRRAACAAGLTWF
jgi:hypothetical protein